MSLSKNKVYVPVNAENDWDGIHRVSDGDDDIEAVKIESTKYLLSKEEIEAIISKTWSRAYEISKHTNDFPMDDISFMYPTKKEYIDSFFK